MFYKRLEKAMKQEFKNTTEVVEYCKKEMNRNYSERKLTEMQCICEYLIYRIENKLDISFEKYQEIQFKEMWGV